jgi:hypothetical protein
MKSMNKFELTELGLIELSQEELMLVNGGDKFMKDLGYIFGAIGGFVERCVVETGKVVADTQGPFGFPPK